MNRSDPVTRLGADERGLSLIELVVAILLSGILSIVIASILANSWQTQEDVVTVTAGTDRGQVLGAAIERAVRNAVAVEVLNGGTVLRTRTTLDGALACQGFVLTDGEARWSSSTSLLGSSAGWPIWKDGIAQRGTTPFFVQELDGTVAYTFDIKTESSPVRFAGEVSPRSLSVGSSSCW